LRIQNKTQLFQAVFRIRSYPDLFGRIRTSGTGSGSGSRSGSGSWPYIVNSNLNFFGMCKSHKYFRSLCCLTFWFMKLLFRAYFHQKNFWKKVGLNLYRSGSGRFQKSDLDSVKNRPDPQHWFQAHRTE
jgi:hypothetical protein